MYNFEERDKIIYKRRLAIILVIAIAILVPILFFGIPSSNKQSSDLKPTNSATEQPTSNNNDKRSQQMNITINGTTLNATMEDNTSAQALLDILKSGPLTLNMHDYGGMEKVGNLDTTLPTNDQQIITQPGDIILYQGNQITIYYDTNQWSLTKLGHIDNISTDELRQLLGDGDIVATFSL